LEEIVEEIVLLKTRDPRQRPARRWLAAAAADPTE
jgi:hypothetical protein